MHRTSNVYFFFFLEVPPELSLSRSPQRVTEGDNVNLTCEIIDGVPRPELIHWRKDKMSLDKKTTKMFLWSIKKEQEGNYTCETSNEGGSAKNSIEVIVDSKTL